MTTVTHPVERLKYQLSNGIIYENIFIFDKVMCKLLRKYKFFSYLHIHTYPQTCLYIFKCHTKLNHFQTPQHLFSKTRQNLQKNKVCCGHKVLGRLMQEKLGYICRPIISTQCGILYFRSSTLN